MKLLRISFLLNGFSLLTIALQAQNYQAIHGSSYAGSLGPANNPSSIVQVPYSWDITLFAFQMKQATNAITITNYSLLSNPSHAKIIAVNGTKKRLAYAEQNLRLLNGRIAISPKSAFAFGINIRSNVFLQTSPYNWNDSINTLRNFGTANISQTPLSANLTAASWAEIYGTYAQTIKNDGIHILNAGVTLKINRGLAGAYAKAQDINFIPDAANNNIGFLLTEGSLQYGYSSNLDNVNGKNNFSANRKNFLQNTFSSIGFDAGIEYIQLSGEENNYDYDTKIGASLMDAGKIKFSYSANSRFANVSKNNIPDPLLQNTFQNVTSLNEFNDSLARVSNSIVTPGGDFFINLPTRLILNADKHFSGNIFLNAELTLPFMPPALKNKLYLREMNFLTVTPRWENRTFGAYLPIQFNRLNELWIGGAIKAGPLLLGIHNWANLFSKNSTQKGGFYLALTIRPGSHHDKAGNNIYENMSRTEKQKLDCPRF